MLLYVTGSRTFSNDELFREVLADINPKEENITLLAGGSFGAEDLALQLAKEKGWEVDTSFESIEDWKDRVDSILLKLIYYTGEKLVIIFNQNSEGSNYIQAVCSSQKIPSLVYPLGSELCKI